MCFLKLLKFISIHSKTKKLSNYRCYISIIYTKCISLHTVRDVKYYILPSENLSNNRLWIRDLSNVGIACLTIEIKYKKYPIVIPDPYNMDLGYGRLCILWAFEKPGIKRIQKELQTTVNFSARQVKSPSTYKQLWI